MKRAAISPNAVARKLDSNLGSENQGKVLGVDSTGAVVPVEMSSGAKLYIVSGTITNASGSYTTTINNEFITAEMKAVEMELGTPSIFGDKITVTCGAGFVTISCPSVSGTSTYKISLIKSIDDPTAVTSTEFDILSNRIGTLSNLHTTDKTTIVAAVNENTDAITKKTAAATYESGVNVQANTTSLSKSGCICVYTCFFSLNSIAANTQYKIATLPEGYRPTHLTLFTGAVFNATTGMQMSAITGYLNTNGDVVVRTCASLPSTPYITFNVAYMV